MKSKKKSGKTKMNKDQVVLLPKEMSIDQSVSVEFREMYITKTHDIFDLFGFRPEELKGVSIHVLFPESQDDDIPTKSRLSEILSDFNNDSSLTLNLKFQHRYGHIFKETVQLKSVGKDTFTFEFSLKSQGMTDQMLENLTREDPSVADFIHHTPILIRMSNDKNQFYYFSKQWLNFTGSTLKEEVNGGWLDHIFPDDTRNVQDTLQNAFNNKSKYDLSYRLIRFDNQQCWIYESGIPIFDNDADFIGHLAVSLDISRIKDAEDLIDNESTFKILAEHAPVLFRMTDEHNLEYYFSKQWLQFTGKGIKEETNQGWTKNIHSEDYLYVNEKLQFSLANSKKYEITYRLQNKAGEYRWMFETGIPIFSHMGNFTGFISAAIDISERKIAEEKESKKQAFLESEKKLQASLNYSNLISLTVDNHKHISYCNDYFVELIGLEKEEIIGQEVYTYLEFMDAEGNSINPLEDIFNKTGFTHSFEAFLKSPFREKFTITFSSIVLYTEGGQFPSITLVGENITEKRKVGNALRTSNQQLKNLFDSANDLIQIVSPEGNFLFVNKTWKDKLGYSNDDIPNIKFQDILDENVREMTINKLSEITEENEEIKIDTVLLTKAGDKVFVTGNLNCSFLHGRKKECRGIFYDVTERLKAEKAQSLYYSISNLAFNSADLDSLFVEIHKELQKIVNADNFYVALCDEKKTYIHFPYFKDEKNKEFGEINRRDFGHGLTEYAIANQKPVFYTEKDLKELQEKKKLIIHGSIPKIWLGVPLKQGGNIIGIIVVQSYGDKKAYSRKDLDLLVFISSQIATAIDRQQKQEKIREQAARLQSIFESGSHMIWSVNRSLIFSSYNQNFSEFLKVNFMTDSVFKKPPIDINEINAANFWKERYEQAFNGKIVQFELKFKNHKTKKISWNNIVLSPIYLEDKVIEEVSGIAYDITDNKLSEIAVAQSEEKFRDIFESFQDVYFRCSFEGDIIMLSPSVKELLGYEAEELTGKDVTNYYLYSKKSKDLLKNLVREKSIRDFEAALIHKNGSIIQCLCNLRLVYDNKINSIAMEGVARDITKLKETNLELKQAKEVAERSLKVKELFLANMSHEIRTPMNGIIGMIDLMEGTTITPDQKHYIQTIKKSSETLLNILNDILDLSKIEAGKMQLKQEPVKLRNTMDKIYALFAQQALAKNINLYYHLSEKLPEYVMIDETRLLQILSNLISNAIKFTEGGGSIDIDLKKARLPGKKNMIRCVVSDSGIGISPENIRRLFGIFSQIDNTTTKSYSGTGLGLAISKELARLMGGKIGVYSTLGLGSSFWFTFDAEPTEKTVIVENKIVDNDIKIEGYFDQEKPSILLVDDNGVNRQVAGEILKKSGCIVTLVENGKKAIEMVSSNDYDLIFMDIQMPEMDGVTATKRIKAMNLKVQPPIVAMTAYSMKEDKERFLSQGLDDYIAKPIRANDLLNKVRQWVLDEQIFSGNGGNDNDEGEILNMDTVNQLIDLGGEEMVHQVFDDFLSETIEHIESSQKAVGNGNYEEIKRNLHTLKGNAGTLGVEKLSKQAEFIERNIKNENYETLEQELKFLNLTFEEFKNKFNQILKKPKDERP